MCRYCLVSSAVSFWLPSAGIVYFYVEVRIAVSISAKCKMMEPVFLDYKMCD